MRSAFLGHATHHLARLHRSRPSLGLLTPLRPQLCVQDIPDSLLKSKRPRLAEDPGGDGASIRAAWSTREANLTDALEKLRASAAQAAQSAIVSRGEIVSKERDVQAAREVANERDRAATQARAELSIAEASLQDAVAEEGGHTAAATQHQAKVFKLERLEKDDASVMMHQIHKRWLKENKEKKAAAAAAAASALAAAASDAAADASGVDTAAAASGGAAAAASALAAAASGAAATASALAANSSAAAANSSAPPADNSSGGGQPLGGEEGAVTSWIEGVTGGREAEDFRHSEMVLELRRITNELTAQLGVEKEWMKLPEASDELDYDYEGLSRLESLVEAFEAEVQAADEYLADEADEADEAEAGRVEERNKNIEKLKALNLKMQGLLAQADDQRKNGEWVAVGATNREIAPVRREIESVRGLLNLRKGDAVPEPLAPPPALLGPPAGPLAPPAALHAPPAGPLAQPAAPLAPAAPLGPAEPEPPEAAPSAAAAAPSVVAASATVTDTSAAPAAAASAASSVSS